MRFFLFIVLAVIWGCPVASAAEALGGDVASATNVEVTADQSMEWYRDQGIYVARGNAKAVRGDLVVSADMLTAHQRDRSDNAQKDKGKSSGDIDRMTAEGNVIITKGDARIVGDHAMDDVDKNVIIVTGSNLRYESGDQIVTAKESLEYWDVKKLAVARGGAVAKKGDRRVSGDVLTAEFREQPDGNTQLDKVSAIGNVTVMTKSDITRGDKGVYDAARDIAIISGNVRITRSDGTELVGEVGEADFASGQSRLMSDGTGKVRALISSKPSSASKRDVKGAHGDFK